MGVPTHTVGNSSGQYGNRNSNSNMLTRMIPCTTVLVLFLLRWFYLCSIHQAPRFSPDDAARCVFGCLFLLSSTYLPKVALKG